MSDYRFRFREGDQVTFRNAVDMSTTATAPWFTAIRSEETKAVEDVYQWHACSPDEITEADATTVELAAYRNLAESMVEVRDAYAANRALAGGWRVVS